MLKYFQIVMSECARALSPWPSPARTAPVSVTPPGRPSGRTGASVWSPSMVTTTSYWSAPDQHKLNSANSNCLSSYIVLNLSDVYLYLSNLRSKSIYIFRMRAGRLCYWKFNRKYSFCIPPINRTTGLPQVSLSFLWQCGSATNPICFYWIVLSCGWAGANSL